MTEAGIGFQAASILLAQLFTMNYSGHFLDPVRHCFHPVKEENASEKNENDGRGGNEQQQARSLAAGGDGPAETVNDGRHDERGKVKNGIREAVGEESGEFPEEESEAKHVEDGLQDDPEDADGGLFIADFDVAPDEEIEQLAVGPDLAEAQLKKVAGRFNANGRGGAGARRKESGLWR